MSSDFIRRDLGPQRREYHPAPLTENDLAATPFEQFETWYQQAERADCPEPNAMVLATVAADGHPTQRTVLLKYFDTSGFVFFTNYESRKARHLADNDRVSLLFLWLPLERQVEINGRAAKVSSVESLKYFVTRPRGSQLGAWVSRQSSVISSRSLLESKWAELTRKFSGGEIPVPSFWGGFRVVPDRFEFWQGGQNRLHDRFEYLPTDPQHWQVRRLAP
jgi:pyridoxamine 5'-phosphate oxidase